MKHRAATLVATTTASLMLLTACTDASPETAAVDADAQDELTSVTWIWPTDSALHLYPLTLAQELGYFEEEGLDVTIEALSGTTAVLQQIIAGNAEFGYGASQGTYLAASETPGGPIRVFYNLLNRGFAQVYAPRDRGITTVHDLAGHTVGVDDLTSGETVLVRSAVSSVGLDPDKDIGVEAVTEMVSAQFAALEAGRIDAMAAPLDFKAAADAEGWDLVCVTCDMPAAAASNLVVHADFLEEHPDLVAGFGRAVAKASVFGEANPEATIEIVRQLSPQELDNDDFANALMREALGNVIPEDRMFGELRVDDWHLMIEQMAEHEVEQRGEVDLNDLLVLDLAEQINDFDADEIREQAQEWSST